MQESRWDIFACRWKDVLRIIHSIEFNESFFVYFVWLWSCGAVRVRLTYQISFEISTCTHLDLSFKSCFENYGKDISMRTFPDFRNCRCEWVILEAEYLREVDEDRSFMFIHGGFLWFSGLDVSVIAMSNAVYDRTIQQHLHLLSPAPINHEYLQWYLTPPDNRKDLSIFNTLLKAITDLRLTFR